MSARKRMAESLKNDSTSDPMELGPHLSHEDRGKVVLYKKQRREANEIIIFQKSKALFMQNF